MRLSKLKNLSSKKKTVLGFLVLLPFLFFLFVFIPLHSAGYSYQEAKSVTRLNAELNQIGGGIFRIIGGMPNPFSRAVDRTQTAFYSCFGIEARLLKEDAYNIKFKGAKSYDDFLKKLPQLKKIVRFIFESTDITDDTIQHLLKQKQIIVIKFNNCSFKTNNFNELSDLKKIGAITFENMRIPEKILKNDLKSIKLEALAFVGCPVSENNIKYLEELKELQNLSLYDVDLSEKIIQDLKKSLPDCSVTIEK